MKIEYSHVPHEHVRLVAAMVERITVGLQTNRTWRSLQVRVNGRLKSKEAEIEVQWDLLHARIDISAAMFEGDKVSRVALYNALVHEFTHMVTWPFREGIDAALAHIGDAKRRRATRKVLLKQYEHINEDMRCMIGDLLPWSEAVEKQLGLELAPDVPLVEVREP